MKGVAVGRIIAYEGETAKRCRIGKVLSVSEDQSEVSVHVYEARADHRLQVVWSPAFSVLEGAEYQQQVIETIPAARVLGTVELNRGVLNHASASRLHRAGWRLHEAVVKQGALVAVVSDISHEPTTRMHALVSACAHEAALRRRGAPKGTRSSCFRGAI